MKKDIKISIIIPTNKKRPEMLQQVLLAISKQDMIENCEIIVVSEVDDNFDYMENVLEISVPYQNGIFRNIKAGFKVSKGSYLLLLDDDILLEDSKTISKLYRFLQEHAEVWAVGPFINENKGLYKSVGNYFYDIFKKLFKIWDPEDYTNKIYSCFGKGSANHSDRLPSEPYIGCQWLTNQALLVRRDIYEKFHDDDLDTFSLYHQIEKIWAVDFYLTHRLYLKNYKALAFYPKTKVMHLGADSTSFNVGDRILRETVCGYYYYHRFLRHKSFYTTYVLPCIGRFLYIILTNWKKPVELARSLYLYLYSFYLLKDKREIIKYLPSYV